MGHALRHHGAIAVGSLSLFAGAAFAAPGPDVIVGDIVGVSHYTSAPIDGRRAYAIGTTSCNIGTQQLSWISSNNQHPVISQNMYRLQDGRFEQIGQSWLKHGFTALQQSLCGPCQPSGTGSRLGVGCSDPYSSSLNGSQNNLGPKSEVNASTGFFPFPYVNRGSTSTALGKRLVVKETDLAHPSAQFFVASMYIAADDAAAGNNLNNQSYRRITVNQSNKTIAMSATTQRTLPAIQAWKDHGLGVNQPDPDVRLSHADVPEDGRFYVGVKVTDLGDGRWSYEYALNNFNSHRSAQAVTLPLPASATLESTGFHAPEYHSGEPYTNDPWTFSRSGQTISWGGQAFVDNQNANALRWDTIYNVRFITNTPPVEGELTLTLFRPGTMGAANTVAVSTFVPAVPVCPADRDADGQITSNDITVYLADWFNDRAEGTIASDMNDDGVINTADITAFLSGWFAARASGGC